MEDKVLKHIYKAIILICVFIAAIYYFSRDIKEVIFNIDNTTQMEEAAFPLVTLKTAEEEINLLHGYSSNLNANLMREGITPLDFNQTFDVVIDQEDSIIKKLKYELREIVGNDLVETDSISVFEENDNTKIAKIKFKAELTTAKEYAVKITLITSESKKIYYYHRIKVYEDANLSEKIAFVMDFHNAIMKKNTAEDMIKYLEPKEEADNTSLCYVNINSSFELVSWGNLNPTIITEVIPTVKECYVDTASIELDYTVKAEILGVEEYYTVKEFYRVRFTSDRMYLLNYERTMESLFDVNVASLAKSEFKLGISSEYEVPYVESDDGKRLAFVRGRELWYYDLVKNQMVRVFSFRQKNSDYIRDTYDQHDIKILNMDAEGNINFIVYGYMNRGQYEGSVAIILYQYVCSENRIEERVYIPVDEPYQTIKENMGKVAFVNSLDVFYFNIYDKLYSFNLITKRLNELASKIDEEIMVESNGLNYIAWQDSADPRIAKKIHILNLQTEEEQTISAPTGYNIRLLDMIDSNIIYGYVLTSDITKLVDGSVIVPLDQVEIATVTKKVLKSYQKSDYYVTDIVVKDNVVELSRVQKVIDNERTTYRSAAPDYIMNQVNNETPLIAVTARVTDQAFKELYLTMPIGFVMNGLPTVTNTVNTVIDQDPTLRLPESLADEECYYPYIMGGIEGSYEKASDAIKVAEAGAGSVLNNNQQLVWERGIRTTMSTISKFEDITWTASNNDSIEQCIEMMLSYQGINVKKELLNVTDSSIYDVLLKNSNKTPIRVTGITLEEALYYVYKGRPVLAMKDQKNAVLMYGYDAYNIMLIDPQSNKKVKMGIQDSTQMFEEAGNVFLTYLE